MTKENYRLDSDGCVHLSGELTFDSSPGIFDGLRDPFRSRDEITSIDLSLVERIDSSGLALILEWQAMINRQQGTLRIINAPSSLLRLAKLCEADKLLEMTSR